MPDDPIKSPLPGSNRDLLPNSTLVGPVDPSERVEVSVIVRPRSAAANTSAETLGMQWPAERKHLSREEFEASSGADPADVAKIEEFARGNKLEVLE